MTRQKKGMILTVGTGTAGADIAEPLIQTIRCANPDLVLFLVSGESEKVALRVAKELRLGRRKGILRIPNVDDIESCYETALSAFREMQSRGIAPDLTTADFTSGTKAMSAGLVLAAATCRAASLSYVHGNRERGIVAKGRGRVTAIRPTRVFALLSFHTAKDHMERLLFNSVEELLDHVVNLLPDDDKKSAGALRGLAFAYHRWELFDYGDAAQRFRKHTGDTPPDLRRFLPHEGAVECLENLARAKDSRRPTLDFVADLVCNAERRYREGRYDDAMARLYRATEALAQLRLRENHSLDASDLDIARLPEDLREKYGREHAGDDANPTIRIGLREAYELLRDLGDAMGKEFMQAADSWDGVLGARNGSPLGHGFQSVEKRHCDRLMEMLRDLARAHYPEEFEAACRTLTFPWTEAPQQ